MCGASLVKTLTFNDQNSFKPAAKVLVDVNLFLNTSALQTPYPTNESALLPFHSAMLARVVTFPGVQ